MGILAIGLVASATSPSQAAPVAGGTSIVNSATAAYVAGGTSFVSLTNTVTTTVAQVGGLAVSPNQSAVNQSTDAIAIGSPLVRTFVLTNTSNIADAYVVTATACAPATLTSATYPGPTGPVAIVLGQTVLPTIQPGGTIAVTVTCATTGLAPSTTIPVVLTARTTAPGTVNGIQTASGKQYGYAVPPPSLTGVGGPATSISKTVGSTSGAGSAAVAVAPGASTVYTISFMNSGNAPATNVVMSDTFPAGVTPDPASVTLNGLTTGFTAKVSGQTLTVAVGTLNVKGVDIIRVNAAVSGAQVAGVSAVNVASVSADGLPATPTTAATVLVGTSNVVYDGLGGPGKTISGAVVTLVDPTTNKPIALTSTGVAPNTANANPYVTGGDGVYQFSPFMTGATTPLSHFIITIVTPNYANRRIDVTTSPTTVGASGTSAAARSPRDAATPQLYTVTLTSLDGQPLAQAGGFTLTTSNVRLADVFNLLGNLPLFSARPITVTKTVDRTQASAGDKLIFDISYTNAAAGSIGSGNIIDTMPPGLLYIPNSAKIDGVSVTPTIIGNQLIWPIGALLTGISHKLEYAAVIAAGTPPNTKLTNNVSVNGLIPGTTLASTGTASVDIFVSRGLFSQSMVITGRVFIDKAGTGHFRKGDAGVPGVRVYLESGEFALTDANGRFEFPAVRPNAHVLRLDPLSFPTGVSAFRDGRFSYDNTRSTERLVHGLFDTGTMQDVNFALQGQTP
jgi:uncharacterized repeat protein (TIGR01451 family)